MGNNNNPGVNIVINQVYPDKLPSDEQVKNLTREENPMNDSPRGSFYK
jgi:hypothetical protein